MVFWPDWFIWDIMCWHRFLSSLCLLIRSQLSFENVQLSIGNNCMNHMKVKIFLILQKLLYNLVKILAGNNTLNVKWPETHIWVAEQLMGAHKKFKSWITLTIIPELTIAQRAQQYAFSNCGKYEKSQENIEILFFL